MAASLASLDIRSSETITIQGDPRCGDWNSIEYAIDENLVCIPKDVLFIGDFE